MHEVMFRFYYINCYFETIKIPKSSVVSANLVLSILRVTHNYNDPGVITVVGAQPYRSVFCFRGALMTKSHTMCESLFRTYLALETVKRFPVDGGQVVLQSAESVERRTAVRTSFRRTVSGRVAAVARRRR